IFRDETEDKPVVVGVTQRKMRSSRLLRPCSMEGSDTEAAASKRFHDAVKAGDVTTLTVLLATGLIDPDDPNRNAGGSTAILEATRHNRPEVAAALLNAGCDPSLGDNSGWTAMHEVFKSPSVARLLLQSPTARWNLADSAGGLTPLHSVVKSAVSTSAVPSPAQLEVLKEVTRKSNVGAVTCTKDTALHLAASGRHDRPDVVRTLLDAMPSMTLCNAQNDRGETPLHLAVVNGNYETALTLLENVDVIRRESKGGLTRKKNKLTLPTVAEGSVEGDVPGKKTIQKPKRGNLNEVKPTGRRSQEEELRNHQDIGDRSETTSQNGDKPRGANDEEQGNDGNQETADIDANQGRLQQVSDQPPDTEPEVKQGGNDKIQDKNGTERSSDREKTEKGHEHQGVLNHQENADTNGSGITINIQDADQDVSPGNSDEETTNTVKQFDNQNGDQNGNAPNRTRLNRIEVDLCDRFGQTVLHYCAARNATNVLEPLLRNNGVCDVQDLQGDTALHVAARRGHDRCLALLLQFGADPSLRNSDGRTALDLAVAAGFADATKVLYENATEPVLRNADALRRQDSVRRCTRIGRIFLADEVPNPPSATE
ncbi:unnamed protein product, partial [Ixodes hexagonus]